MNRRELLSRIPLFLIAIPAVASCVAEESYPPRPPGGGGGGGGGGDDSPDAASAPAGFEVENQDTSGHSHSFVLTCASLEARQATYVAAGSHTHMVTLTDANIDDIVAGRTVTIETTAGHPHKWVIAMPASTCA